MKHSTLSWCTWGALKSAAPHYTKLLAATFAVVLAVTTALGQSVNLDQAANGPVDAPVDPAVWQNGNVNENQAHYSECQSVGYRAIMNDLPTDGTVIRLTLGYDVAHSDHIALDFLTHYQRLEPHALYGHASETIDPLIGIGVSFGAPSTFPIPAPPSTGSPVPGQPTGSFDEIDPSEKLFTLWGGTILDVQYEDENGNPSFADWANYTTNQQQEITVYFTVTSSTAVLAWGGHIACGLDWGDLSAGGISGSPYHMRILDWNLSNLGNQDRSLSASAVTPVQECTLECPADVELTCDVYNSGAYEIPGPVVNCSLDAVIDITFSDEFSGICPLVITRTYTIDIDGQIGTCTQTITVTDTTAPWATFVPADATYECDEQYSLQDPTFADNCDNNLTVVPSSSTQLS
ncbi:MAG: hypothetical protein RL220_1316, partial [Bacteroidota bacterium]